MIYTYWYVSRRSEGMQFVFFQFFVFISLDIENKCSLINLINQVMDSMFHKDLTHKISRVSNLIKNMHRECTCKLQVLSI